MDGRDEFTPLKFNIYQEVLHGVDRKRAKVVALHSTDNVIAGYTVRLHDDDREIYCSERDLTTVDESSMAQRADDRSSQNDSVGEGNPLEQVDKAGDSGGTFSDPSDSDYSETPIRKRKYSSGRKRSGVSTKAKTPKKVKRSENKKKATRQPQQPRRSDQISQEGEKPKPRRVSPSDQALSKNSVKPLSSDQECRPSNDCSRDGATAKDVTDRPTATLSVCQSQSTEGLSQKARELTNAEASTSQGQNLSDIMPGDRIEVYWPDYDEYVCATVMDRRDEDTFYLLYDGGDQQWTDLSKEMFQVLKHDGGAPVATTKISKKDLDLTIESEEKRSKGNLQPTPIMVPDQRDVCIRRGSKKPFTQGTKEYRDLVAAIAESRRKWSKQEAYKVIREQLGRDRRFLIHRLHNNDGDDVWQIAAEAEIKKIICQSFSRACSRNSGKPKRTKNPLEGVDSPSEAAGAFLPKSEQRDECKSSTEDETNFDHEAADSSKSLPRSKAASSKQNKTSGFAKSTPVSPEPSSRRLRVLPRRSSTRTRTRNRVRKDKAQPKSRPSKNSLMIGQMSVPLVETLDDDDVCLGQDGTTSTKGTMEYHELITAVAESREDFSQQVYEDICSQLGEDRRFLLPNAGVETGDKKLWRIAGEKEIKMKFNSDFQHARCRKSRKANNKKNLNDQSSQFRPLSHVNDTNRSGSRFERLPETKYDTIEIQPSSRQIQGSEHKISIEKHCQAHPETIANEVSSRQTKEVNRSWSQTERPSRSNETLEKEILSLQIHSDKGDQSSESLGPVVRDICESQRSQHGVADQSELFMNAGIGQNQRAQQDEADQSELFMNAGFGENQESSRQDEEDQSELFMNAGVGENQRSSQQDEADQSELFMNADVGENQRLSQQDEADQSQLFMNDRARADYGPVESHSSLRGSKDPSELSMESPAVSSNEITADNTKPLLPSTTEPQSQTSASKEISVFSTYVSGAGCFERRAEAASQGCEAQHTVASIAPSVSRGSLNEPPPPFFPAPAKPSLREPELQNFMKFVLQRIAEEQGDVAIWQQARQELGLTPNLSFYGLPLIRALRGKSSSEVEWMDDSDKDAFELFILRHDAKRDTDAPDVRVLLEETFSSILDEIAKANETSNTKLVAYLYQKKALLGQLLDMKWSHDFYRAIDNGDGDNRPELEMMASTMRFAEPQFCRFIEHLRSERLQGDGIALGKPSAGAVYVYCRVAMITILLVLLGYAIVWASDSRYTLH